MQTFCQRYPNAKIIDVVNEPPPHATPAYIDGMGGTGTTGNDWIVNAFKWAREFCRRRMPCGPEFYRWSRTASRGVVAFGDIARGALLDAEG